MNMPQIIIDSQYAKLITLCMSCKLTQQLSNFDQTSNTLPDHVTRCVTNYSCLSSFTVELVKHSKWIFTPSRLFIFFLLYKHLLYFFSAIQGKHICNFNLKYMYNAPNDGLILQFLKLRKKPASINRVYVQLKLSKSAPGVKFKMRKTNVHN